MNVPPIFPEPITVPGNAAEAPYDVRLRFVRRVIAGHAAAWSAVAVAAAWLPDRVDRIEPILGFALIVMAILHFTRRFFRRGHLDRWFGAALFGLLLALLAWAGGALHRTGWPVAVLPAAALGMGLYALAAGRDFSFVGQGVLVGLGLAAGLVAGVFAGVWSPADAVLGLGVGVPFLAYAVYDLAMILKRRRPDEVALSVVDLFRDPLNFTTYGLRVIRHWQRVRV